MKSIEVAVLNPEVIPSAEKMMVCAARLTQRGHQDQKPGRLHGAL